MVQIKKKVIFTADCMKKILLLLLLTLGFAVYSQTDTTKHNLPKDTLGTKADSLSKPVLPSDTSAFKPVQKDSLVPVVVKRDSVSAPPADTLNKIKIVEQIPPPPKDS